MEQIEIMLSILNYVQGELFNDAKVSDIGAYDTRSYVDLTCRNNDKIKIQVEYEPHAEEPTDV